MAGSQAPAFVVVNLNAVANGVGESGRLRKRRVSEDGLVMVCVVGQYVI
jgi:hypothetical protein